MQHLEIRLNTYFDIFDQPQFIRGCSITNIEKLKKLYNVFWFEISKVDPTLEIDFLSVIGINKRVFNTANKIIEICNLDPDGIDLDLLAALVHSYIDEDGKPHKGYIAEMHFAVKESLTSIEIDTGIKSQSWEEYYYGTLTNLTKLEGSLEKAVKLIEDYPQDMIEGYLITNYKQIKEQIDNDPNNEDSKRERYKAMYEKRFGRKKSKKIEPQTDAKDSLINSNSNDK